MPKYTSISEAIGSNTQGFCNVPDCHKKRTGVSAYCLSHRNAHARYGHPQQRKLLVSQHAAERSQVTEIFNSNANHPGISSATQWVQQWLDAVMRGEKTAIAAEDMRRLVDNGVAARDIVIEAASFFLYQQWNRHKFLNDDAVNMALSLAVLTLAPPGKKTRVNPDGSQSEVRMEVKAAPRKKVGRYIRSHLIDLFLNLQKTIEDNRGAAISTKAAMRSPLVFPAVLMATTDPTT